MRWISYISNYSVDILFQGMTQLNILHYLSIAHSESFNCQPNLNGSHKQLIAFGEWLSTVSLQYHKMSSDSKKKLVLKIGRSSWPQKCSFEFPCETESAEN